MASGVARLQGSLGFTLGQPLEAKDILLVSPRQSVPSGRTFCSHGKRSILRCPLGSR